jgi:hypothetical protein
LGHQITRGTVLHIRLSCKQAPVGTCQLAPEIGSVVEPGDKMSGDSRGIERRGRPPLKAAIEDPGGGVVLEDQALLSCIRIDHHKAGGVEGEPLGLRRLEGLNASRTHSAGIGPWVTAMAPLKLSNDNVFALFPEKRDERNLVQEGLNLFSGGVLEYRSLAARAANPPSRIHTRFEQTLESLPR